MDSHGLSTPRRAASVRIGKAIVLGIGAAVLLGIGAAMALPVPLLAADEEPAPPSVPPGGLALTPAQIEGPFYPLELPADRDADLAHVVGSATPALGQPLTVNGWLLHADGSPVAGATVEIWQTDHQGIYLHPGDPDVERRDPAFQGYGETVTGDDGRWSFRTILPEVYGGRPRHIHVKARIDGDEVLTTQIYFSGGDIPPEGAVDLTGTDLDALVVEAALRPSDDGQMELTADHLLVVP